MAAIIYDPVKFHKKMEKMERAGGSAALAAEQAREMIGEVAGRDNLPPRLRCMLTQYGDARIKNCYKFDLRGAYRLVYVRQDGWFVFLFLGSHDETDSWIRNNNGMIPDITQGEVVPGKDIPDEPEPLVANFEDMLDVEPAGIHDLDVPLDEILDQKTLRDIFPGICGHH